MSFSNNLIKASSIVALIVSLIAIAFLIAMEATSKDSSCYKNQKNEVYCEFLGDINSVYVNESGVRIIEFDSPISSVKLQEYKIDVKSDSKAVIGLGPEADLLFSVLVDAKLNNHKVKVHTHGVKDGFLYLDHVWLK